MRSDLESLVALLRDPQNRETYRARCARARERQAQLEQVATRAGLPLWELPAQDFALAPKVEVTLPAGTPAQDRRGGRYHATIGASCLVDVFRVEYHALFDNPAPEEVRHDPSLQVYSAQPLLGSMQAIEEIVVPDLVRTGLRRLATEELWEYCPGVRVNDSVDVWRALEVDLNGWLDDRPEPDVTPPAVAPLRNAALALYAQGAGSRILESARAEPPWLVEIERVLRGSGGEVERLSPAMYPSASWTVDFGEVRNGPFHARFFTDVHASKLAPAWYYADRFTLEAVDPESLHREVHGWTCRELGYLRAQTEMMYAVRELLGGNGFTLLDEWQLTFYVAGLPALTGQRDRAILSELLFRDVLGLCPPAPRVEEEHPNRNIRPRVGPLR